MTWNRTAGGRTPTSGTGLSRGGKAGRKDVDAGNHWSAVTSTLLPPCRSRDPPPGSHGLLTWSTAAGDFSDAGLRHVSGACASYASDEYGQHWTCIRVGSFWLPDPFQPFPGLRPPLRGGEGLECERGPRPDSWSLLDAARQHTVAGPDPQRPGNNSGRPEPFRPRPQRRRRATSRSSRKASAVT